MAAEAMLNKNRMMVFKNKGKDQEVSEFSLPSNGEVTEFLARWKLPVGKSEYFPQSPPCSVPFFSPPRTRACVYTCELLRFLSDFFTSLFLPFCISLSLVSLYSFHIYSFFSAFLFLSIAVLSLHFPSFSIPFIFFSLNLLSFVFSFVPLVASFIIF